MRLRATVRSAYINPDNDTVYVLSHGSELLPNPLSVVCKRALFTDGTYDVITPSPEVVRMFYQTNQYPRVILYEV